MNENNIEKNDVVYKAKTEDEKAVSFIWIIPIIILCILSWIGYESYMKKGTTISVVFKTAEGLKEGVTTLEYKGLKLGKVRKIGIHEDLKSVKVSILVKSEVAKYVANESSQFWIKKPTISLTKISGLSTLISGYKIEISPKFKTHKEFEDGKKQLSFIGLDSQPDNALVDNGYYISLLVNNHDSIEIGTPIFYNKFQIGEIVSKDFKEENVFIKAYIYDKFNHLVNKSSSFVMNNALKVNYGPGGLNIEVDSLYSALVGGITVSTKNKTDEKIKVNENYILYSDKEDTKEKIDINIKFLSANGIGENTPIIYKGVTIGKLKDIILDENDVNSKAFIYKKYKYLLTNKSQFFIAKAKLGLDGIENLGTIIKGNYISLTYKKGEFTDEFISKDYEDINKHKLNQEHILYANSLNSISKNSKIYFKNIEIGKVLDYGLSKNLNKVKIKISIYEKYKKLINNHTMFYDMSSKLIDIKNLDISVNYSGFKPLLNGAIAIVDVKRKQKVTKKSFKLYSSYKDVQRLKRIYNEGSIIKAYFDNDFKIKKDMAIMYKNQEIGFVKSIRFDENTSRAKLFIYKKYKKYLNKNSRFYKKGVVNLNASLDGLLFEIEEFSSLLNGAIHLDSNTKTTYSKYKIFSSQEDMKNSTNSISIIFDDVEDLKANFSMLTYKGVNVGKVTKISLLKNNTVKVDALIFNDYKSFAKKGTIFYLKKPLISMDKIENIGAAIMAVNIGVIKSSNKKVQKNFIGKDSKPVYSNLSNGVFLKIEAFHASSASVDSPIYYKNVQIGKISKIDLSSDGTRVLMDCLIFNKYSKFVRENSTFYDISGFNMKFSIFSGSKIESNTFTSLLKGGLVVVTPIEYGKKANKNNTFTLKQELREDWQSISPSIK